VDNETAIDIFHILNGNYAPLDTFMTKEQADAAKKDVSRPNLILLETNTEEATLQLEWHGDIIATLQISERFVYNTKHYVTGKLSCTVPFTIGDYGDLESPSERECVGFWAPDIIHKRELAIIQQTTTTSKLPVVIFTTYKDFMHPHIRCLELACLRSSIKLSIRVIPSYNEKVIRQVLPRYGCKQLILDKKQSKKWKNDSLEILTYSAMAYSTKNDCWLPISIIDDDDDDFKTMSSRKYSKMLQEGTPFGEWFTYPEIEQLMYPFDSKRGIHFEIYASDKSHARKEAQKCKSFLETQIQTTAGIKFKGQPITLLGEDSPEWVIDTICCHNGIVITYREEIREGPITISTEPKKGKCQLHIPNSNYTSAWSLCEKILEKSDAAKPDAGNMPPELAAMMGGLGGMSGGPQGGAPGCPTQ